MQASKTVAGLCETTSKSVWVGVLETLDEKTDKSLKTEVVIWVMEKGAVCRCGKVRGKNAKPWRACTRCEIAMCYGCAPSHRIDPIICQDCWRKEYDARRKVEETTPVDCHGCGNKYLPSDMEVLQKPTICKDCYAIVSAYSTAEAAYKRKASAKPGLVECSWGVLEPKEDGGHGYAYYDPGLNLELGDIVLLPPTWLDREVHGKSDGREATVVSTYSNYSGEVQTVSRLIRRAPSHTVTT